MAPQLLHTKCYLPPGLARGVPRPHLAAQLQAGLQAGRRLSLIAAPAGYGKTTVGAAWIRGAALPAVWLTLDAHDNDPGQLLRYLRLAIEQLGQGPGRHLQAALDEPALPPPDRLAAALLHDLEAAGERAGAAGGGRLVLALDDYHKIDQPAVHALLGLLVEHLPPACHLLLMSREDPPLPLPRLRARGELTEIRAQDLRFSVAEAARFLGETMGLDLAPASVAALEARTEGWAASLQLAALSLQGRSPEQAEAFIRAFGGSHRYVFDYLAEEVLGQQGEAVRAFLQQTAVLERFHAPLCRAVTGRADSQALLQQLEQANLFLVPLDDERVWYRYHHLFADYLRSGLPPEEQARLRAGAARWCAEGGLVIEAVQYALASGDADLTAAVVEGAFQQAATWSGGGLAMLVRWVDALPGQVLRARPRLCLDASRALFLSGRPALAAQFLDYAEGALRAGPPAPERDGLLAIAEVYRGALAALHGEVGRAAALVAAAQPRLPAADTLAHARAADTRGLAAALAGDPAQAERWYAEASRLGQAAGVSYLAINARCEVALARLAQGRLGAAAQSCREALALVDGAPLPPTGLALAILGEIAYEQGDLPAAERLLHEGVARAQQGGLRDDLRHAYLLLARLRRARGDLAGAAAALEQAVDQMPADHVPRLAEVAAAWRAQLQLDRGDLAAAQQWAASSAARPPAPAETCQDEALLTLARVALAGGEPARALELARALEGQARAAGRGRTATLALIVQALAREAEGDRGAAVEALAAALRLAAPAGFVRLFLDEGAALAGLLPQARAAAPQLVDRLLAAEDRAAPQPGAPTGLDALSEQELRVLQLVVAGKSNQEIAAALVITVGTAKWHVHNILQKLGVGSRPKAIARARELGLV